MRPGAAPAHFGQEAEPPLGFLRESDAGHLVEVTPLLGEAEQMAEDRELAVDRRRRHRAAEPRGFGHAPAVVLGDALRGNLRERGPLAQARRELPEGICSSWRSERLPCRACSRGIPARRRRPSSARPVPEARPDRAAAPRAHSARPPSTTRRRRCALSCPPPGACSRRRSSSRGARWACGVPRSLDYLGH
jgi:hypothetical protein